MQLTPPDLPPSSAKTEILYVGDQLKPRAFFVDVTSGREYPLFDGGRIGRDPKNDVVFGEASVSRLHATIQLQGNQFVLQNQSQSNPVQVNGSVIQQAFLQDGDRLEFGRMRVIFKQKN